MQAPHVPRSTKLPHVIHVLNCPSHLAFSPHNFILCDMFLSCLFPPTTFSLQLVLFSFHLVLLSFIPLLLLFHIHFSPQMHNLLKPTLISVVFYFSTPAIYLFLGTMFLFAKSISTNNLKLIRFFDIFLFTITLVFSSMLFIHGTQRFFIYFFHHFYFCFHSQIFSQFRSGNHTFF